MPAQSQQQQKLFGLALSVKRGETPRSEASDEILNIVNTMSEKEIEDFASTSHSGIPTKVETQLRGVVREIMRERVLSEAASTEAMGIAAFTATRGDAVQKFIDNNNLDARKLFNYVKGGKLADRMNFVTALVGNPGNKYQKMIISKFRLKESVNESHFKVGDNVECIKSGMSGKIIGLDKAHGGEDEPYYSVETEDGKVVKYAPNALKLRESVNEGKDDFMARYDRTNINLKKGYKHHTEAELNGLYDKLGKLLKNLKVKDATLVFESVTEGYHVVRKGKQDAWISDKSYENLMKGKDVVGYIIDDEGGHDEVWVSKKDIAKVSKSNDALAKVADKYSKFESVNEESYNFGKEEYTKKGLTPTDIHSLAMAYIQTPITKLAGKSLGHRVYVANDLARLTGTTQMDITKRGKPALIVVLLKNGLLDKSEYAKLYRNLIKLQKDFIDKYLLNADPASRMVGGSAARQAYKDMKGEFDTE